MARSFFSNTPAGAIFVVSSVAFMLVPAAVLFFRLIRFSSRNRSMTVAVVGEVMAVDASKGRVRVRYRYEINGQRYCGSESALIDYLDPARMIVPLSDKSVVDRLKTCLEHGVPARVWVNPNYPNQSTLGKDISFSQGAALVFFVVGYGLVAAMLPQLVREQLGLWVAWLIGTICSLAGSRFFRRRTSSAITDGNPV